MAEIVYRFDNTPFGGAHNITLAVDEMPEWYPLGEEVKENLIRADNGKLWKYRWYTKEAHVMSFRSVATHVAATLGSIARSNYSFLWFKDLNNAGGTATMVYVGGEFRYSPISVNLCDFDFTVEELA